MSRFLLTIVMASMIGVFWSVDAVVAGESFGLQVSAFKERDRAVRDAERFKKNGYESFFRPEEIPGKGIWHRVYIGRFPTRGQALEQAQTLKAGGVISDYMIRRLSAPPAVNVATAPDLTPPVTHGSDKPSPRADQVKNAAKDDLLLEFQPEPLEKKATPLAMRPIPDMASPRQYDSARVKKKFMQVEQKQEIRSTKADLLVNSSGETVNPEKREATRFGFPGERQPLSEWDVSGQKSNRVAVKKVNDPGEVKTGNSAGREESSFARAQGQKKSEVTGVEQKQAPADPDQETMPNSQTKLRTYLKGTDDTPDPTSSDSFTDERENESSVGFSLVTTF